LPRKDLTAAAAIQTGRDRWTGRPSGKALQQVAGHEKGRFGRYADTRHSTKTPAAAGITLRLNRWLTFGETGLSLT